MLAHKLRDAMASSVKGLRIGGAYFGGHVRPENRAAGRVDRRRAGNKSGKRRVVVAMRRRSGRTLAQVFGGEDAAESPAWNPLHARLTMQRVNHQDGYSIGGACTNGSVDFCGYWQRAQAA